MSAKVQLKSSHKLTMQLLLFALLLFCGSQGNRNNRCVRFVVAISSRPQAVCFSFLGNLLKFDLVNNLVVYAHQALWLYQGDEIRFSFVILLGTFLQQLIAFSRPKRFPSQGLE